MRSFTIAILNLIATVSLKAAVPIEMTCDLPGIIGKYDWRISQIITQLKLMNEALNSNPELAQEITQLRSDPSYEEPGDELKNCFIFAGESGLDKLLVAKQIAKEAGAKCKIIKSSSLINAYQGSGSFQIEQTFSWVNTQLAGGGTAVVIFEDVDLIAAANVCFDAEAAMQTLCGCLDEYRKDPRVVVICTTNKRSSLHSFFVNRFLGNIIAFKPQK